MAASAGRASAAGITPRTQRQLILLLSGVHLLLSIAAYLRPAADDVPRYFAIAVAHGHPYGDYPVEYPVLAVVIFKAIGAVASDINTYGRVLVTVNLVADAAIAVLLLREWGERTCLLYITLVTPLFVLVLTKLDLLVTAVSVAMVVALRRRHGAGFGALSGAGVALKLWPAFLALTVAGLQRPSPARRAAAWLVGGLVGYGVLTLLYGGVQSVEQVITFRGATHPQLESTIGAIGRLLTSPTAVLEDTSWRVAALPGWLDTAGSVTSLVLALAAAALASRWHADVGTAWLATVSLVLVAAPVLSPQYLVWIIPAAAIAQREGSRRAAAITAVIVVLTWLITVVYASVISGALGAEVLVLVRDILVVAVAGSALTHMRAAGGRLQGEKWVSGEPQPAPGTTPARR